MLKAGKLLKFTKAEDFVSRPSFNPIIFTHTPLLVKWRCYANYHYVLLSVKKKGMKRVTDWLFDTNHPLRFALVALVLALANAYEATHIDNPNGVWYVVSWLFAAAGAVGFLAFMVIAISEHFSKD